MSATTAAENERHYAAEVVFCWACAATQRATRTYAAEHEKTDGLMGRLTRAPEGGD